MGGKKLDVMFVEYCGEAKYFFFVGGGSSMWVHGPLNVFFIYFANGFYFFCLFGVFE